MYLGIIDLGTNAARFSIHELHRKHGTHLVYRDRKTLALGKDVFSQGIVRERAIERTLDAFSEFQATATYFGVEKTVAVATSALREAENGKRLVSKIRKHCGISLRIISGSEEARFIADAVTRRESSLPPHWMIVDIGGGSTELCVGEGRLLHKSLSVPLGAVRLRCAHFGVKHKKAKPDPDRIDVLRQHVRSVLREVSQKKAFQSVPVLFGSSGTLKAVHRIAAGLERQKQQVSRKKLARAVDVLSSLSPREIRDEFSIDSWRSRNLFTGAIILEEIMAQFSVKRFYTTKHSLCEGVLHREFERVFA